jgi:hypothetical protein
MASSRGEPACPASTASFASSDMHPVLMSLVRLVPMSRGCMVGAQLKASSLVESPFADSNRMGKGEPRWYCTL